MERRLCYCKSCASFFIISPEKSCPKCHGQLISSVITEEEWNKSNTEQKDAFKKSLASMSNKSVYRQNEHTAQSARKAQDGSTVQKEKGHDKSVKPERKHVLGKILIALAIGFVVFQLFKPYDGACTDYASAGKKVYKQIAKDSPKAYVSYHTDHYNPLLGTTDEIRSIMNEAYKNNGDPQMGDHLFMRTSWSEEYTAIKQKDGTYNLNITLHMFYNTTTEQEKALKEKADAILTRLDLDGASDYEKVRAIYNYICSNVTYDYDHRGDSSYQNQLAVRLVCHILQQSVVDLCLVGAVLLDVLLIDAFCAFCFCNLKNIKAMGLLSDLNISFHWLFLLHIMYFGSIPPGGGTVRFAFVKYYQTIADESFPVKYQLCMLASAGFIRDTILQFPGTDVSIKLVRQLGHLQDLLLVCNRFLVQSLALRGELCNKCLILDGTQVDLDVQKSAQNSGSCHHGSNQSVGYGVGIALGDDSLGDGEDLDSGLSAGKRNLCSSLQAFLHLCLSCSLLLLQSQEY